MIINPVLYQQGVKLPELENPGIAADLLAGKQLVDQYGNPLTGTMPTATHPKPTLSRSGGTVTAQHVQSAGYTEGGTTIETLTIPTKAGATITPGTSRKTAVSSGYLTTGAVYVAGDTNLTAENIKSGVSIFGVAGNAKIKKSNTITIKNNSSYDRFFYFSPNDETSFVEDMERRIPPNSTIAVNVLVSSAGFLTGNYIDNVESSLSSVVAAASLGIKSSWCTLKFWQPENFPVTITIS